MSFWKRLFGGSAPKPAEAAAAPVLEIDGHTVTATPYLDGGQWQLCGVIAREIDGTLREHRFVRADRFTDRETAIDMVFVKARLIIAQSGAHLFD